MPRVTHTATGPNGETYKRTSATRRYSHVVIGRPCVEAARRRAEGEYDLGLKEYRSNARYAREGYEPAAWMIGKPHYDQVAHPGKDHAEVFREAGRESALKWLSDKPATAEEYAARRRDSALAAVEDGASRGVYDRFVPISWSSRLDLANKAASSCDGNRQWYAEVRVVDVDPA